MSNNSNNYKMELEVQKDFFFLFRRILAKL